MSVIPGMNDVKCRWCKRFIETYFNDNGNYRCSASCHWETKEIRQTGKSIIKK